MKALIIVESGFQDEEFVYPLYRMQEEGWEVDIASPDGKVRHGKYGVPARAHRTFAAVMDFDVLMIPGGFECPDRLRMRGDVQLLVQEAWKQKKLIAAICHGPWVLISASIAKGAAMTGYESIRPDIENAGATYIDTPVVVWAEDSNIERKMVTAQHYRYNGEFMKAVIAAARPVWGPELCGAGAANL